MRLQISHTTRYQYDQIVQLLPHLLYLRPRDSPILQVSRFELTYPESARLYWIRDDFDNTVASLHFSEVATSLEIRSECEVVTTETPPFDFLLRDYARTFPFAYEPLHRFNLGIYLTAPEPADLAAVEGLMAKHFIHRPQDTVAWLVAINEVLSTQIGYRRREEPGIQSAAETVSLCSGSCRDHATLLVTLARAHGLAARFVSGYLFDPNAQVTSTGGDMHAWTEVYLPGAGWRGMDPSRGIFCDNAYVPVAHAAVPESVNPVQGAYHGAPGANAPLHVNVSIRRND